MDNIQNDPSVERSKQLTYDELIKGITRDSVLRRLRYAPDLPHNHNVTLRVYEDDT